MLLALILLPCLAGSLAFALRSRTALRGLLVATALAHGLLTAAAWWRLPAPQLGHWLRLDATGLLFLSLTSALFVAASVYAVGYLRRETHGTELDEEEGFLFTNAPEAVFVGCLLWFLGAMTLVTMSQHFGLLWISIEATTLASAPLIYFHRHHRSLEATWKYLMICSVGIALALLGNFFLGVAGARTATGALPIELAPLIANARQLHVPWLQGAFILLLVGYGTKMGLAPLHTWLPDAHSESPAVISALLSGALLNCAFLGVVRIYQVCVAAGQAAFARDLLLVLGLLSMAVAAVFILGQTDYKRLLAYSSVEHMGILAVGVGVGGVGGFGALLHAVNHSLTKTMLFLVAGNILAVYQTKSIDQVRGLLRRSPLNGALWIVGFLALTGTPPFGPFLSEFTILRAAFEQDQTLVGVLYLGLLAVIFVGMTTAFLNMAQGQPAPSAGATRPERQGWLALPPVALGCGVLLLGLHIPPALGDLLREAALTLNGP